MDRRRMRPNELKKNMICLGKQGENGAMALVFDCAEWIAECPAGTIRLYVQTAGREEYYPPLGIEGTDRVYVIDSEKATKTAGNGVIELLLIDSASGTTIKSATGYTTVRRSPSAGTEETDGEPGYVRYDAAQALTEEQKAQARSNIGAGTGSGEGGSGEPGADGEDGGYYTPDVDTSGNLTWTPSKTDMPAISGANIKGPAGRDGNDGKDGRGIVSIKRTSGDGSAGTVDTYTITYTDGSTSTYTVTNGKNGQNASGDGTLAVEIDETLSISGAAADAKMTGDKINELKEAIDAKGDPTDEQVSAAVNAYLDANPVSGGINTTAKNLLITILRSGVYTDDQSDNITALETALGGGTTEPEEPDVPVEKTYTISNELINCISSNSTTRVKENASYSATLTANDGYTLTGGTVTVTIGGVDITETTYADGVVTIASVTGNVEIFASAVAVQAEAALPKDGLLAYFDFRTTVYNNAAGTGLTTIEPTLGSGQLFMWAKDSISQQNEYGLVPANTRSWQYSQNGGTTHTALGTAFTVVSLTYGEVPKFGFNYSNTGAKWLFAPKYVDSAGSTVAAETVNGSSFNSDAKTDYNFTTVRADGTTLTEIMDTSRTEFDGSSIDAFDRWLDKVEGNTATGTNGQSYVAMAIYNRALTDVEIESARGFMKTLEVTA